MATIRIHVDQENRVPDANQKSMMAVQQKRSVLGTVDLNKQLCNVPVAKGKQPLGLSNKNNINIKKTATNKENDCTKENRKNIVNPIVPVAQFEAFKVYEDANYEERLARIDEKLKAKSTSNVYKGTAEDRFLTKTEVAEMERQGIIPQQPKKEETPLSSPMSVDKSMDISMPLVDELALRNSSDRNQFFEVEEYREDIYRYLREHELKNRAKPGYMKKQPDVTSNMRSILVDWLVEVAEEYKLETETLYLAVNYIDRFLSYMSVVRAKLQLVGTAAMFLASKYEEIYPPEISEFVYITDDTYNQRQVIRMESLIVKVLGFDLSIPTPLTFISAICTWNKIEKKCKFLAMYICELSLLNGEIYLEFLPSILACSAIALARHTLEEDAWTEELAKDTGYELRHFETCIDFLSKMFTIAPTYPQHAIQDKYKSQKYLHVSQVKPRDVPVFNK